MYKGLVKEAWEFIDKLFAPDAMELNIPYKVYIKGIADAVAGLGPVAQTVALLKDVLNSSDVTLEELRTIFPLSVTARLELLKTYEDYHITAGAELICRTIAKVDYIFRMNPLHYEMLLDEDLEAIAKYHLHYNYLSSL